VTSINSLKYKRVDLSQLRIVFRWNSFYLESKGATVTGGVMKAVLHLLSAMAMLYVCALCTPQGSGTLYRLSV
jgi:hypothetical protein